MPVSRRCKSGVHGLEIEAATRSTEARSASVSLVAEISVLSNAVCTPICLAAANDLEDEAVLQQRFTAADGQSRPSSSADRAVFLNLFHRARQRHRHAVGHFPGVGIVARTQRNWAAASHATTRTPGPSTASRVVNECTKPHSPLFQRSAQVRLGDLFSQRNAHKSYGLAASSGTSPGGWALMLVLRRRGNVRLMTSICCSPGQADQSSPPSRNADGQRGILFRMLLASINIARFSTLMVMWYPLEPKKASITPTSCRGLFFRAAAQSFRHHGCGQGNAVGRVAIGNLRDRRRRGHDAMGIAAMHGVGPGANGSPLRRPSGVWPVPFP